MTLRAWQATRQPVGLTDGRCHHASWPGNLTPSAPWPPRFGSSASPPFSGGKVLRRSKWLARSTAIFRSHGQRSRWFWKALGYPSTLIVATASSYQQLPACKGWPMLSHLSASGRKRTSSATRRYSKTAVSGLRLLDRDTLDFGDALACHPAELLDRPMRIIGSRSCEPDAERHTQCVRSIPNV